MRCDTRELLQEVRNTGFGDALLFRISENLVHRVQGVTGEHPKIAFAGWFVQGEDILPAIAKGGSQLPNSGEIANDTPDWKVPEIPKHE